MKLNIVMPLAILLAISFAASAAAHGGKNAPPYSGPPGTVPPALQPPLGQPGPIPLPTNPNP